MSLDLKTPQQWAELVESVDTFIFDCDGVLWCGTGSAVPGAQDTLKFLREKGKNVYFVSNNSTKARRELLVSFDKLGFEAHENEVFNTSYTAAYYLKQVLNFQKKVYMIGQPELGHELSLQGIPFIGPGPDPVVGSPADWAKMTLDKDVGAVLVGNDREFSYMKLTKACSYLSNPDCVFLGTNEDRQLPINSDTIVVPGTGCMVAIVKYGSSREPIILGKPHEPIFEVIKQSTKLEPSKTLMVGDMLSTDIEFGLRHGMKTLLVLTGNTSRDDVSRTTSKPHYIADTVADLLSCRDF